MLPYSSSNRFRIFYQLETNASKRIQAQQDQLILYERGETITNATSTPSFRLVRLLSW
jgi:hypothetical protein